MKAQKTIAALILMMLAINLYANDSTGLVARSNIARSIALPEFVWGSPEDANTETAELLKYSGFKAPAFVWGTPEDLNSSNLEALKTASPVIAMPEFVWGTADDIDSESVSLLKKQIVLTYPEIVIGNPAEIVAYELK